ncbi:phage tail assembly protein [Stenotrophomonas rhizophila]|uniref:phage tail assembly protein n=1 Tax=Stenotrophomonas rhizophila TaxID=216778 RepID=UPI003515F190
MSKNAQPIPDTAPVPAQSPRIELDVPIQRGEQLIESLQLRKPDAGSLRGIKLVDLLQMDVGAISTLLPRITTPILTAADVAKLDPADLVAVGQEVVTFFMSKATRESLPA